MDTFVTTLSNGLAMLTDPGFVLVVAAATLWGIMSGSMPGLSASLAVGVALPFTFVLNPVQAVASLVAVLVGVNYGNSLPAVALGIPGTPAAILTAQEGFQLHKNGRGATALGVTYVASITGQAVSILVFIAFVVPLAGLAYLFLPAEIFAMTLLGMTAVIGLAGRSIVKGIAAGSFGLLLGLIGRDPINSVPRFTFGVHQLNDGLNVIAVVIGLLAVSELIRSMRQVYEWRAKMVNVSTAFPPLSVIRRCLPAIGIGTVVGSIVGILPGASADAAAFLSYQQAKSRSKTPEEFGHGSLEGIAANEAAQNACQAGDLIPTLAVGIPGGATMVLILAALTMHGLIPGPLLLRETPELLYGSIAGLIVATIALVILGWPLARLAIRVATLNRSIVLSSALTLVIFGVYVLHQSAFDVLVLVFFSVVGYFMIRYGYPVAAAALGLILGGRMESALRQGLLLSDSDLLTMISRPVTATILVIAGVLLVYGILTERRLRARARAGEPVVRADDEDLPPSQTMINVGVNE